VGFRHPLDQFEQFVDWNMDIRAVAALFWIFLRQRPDWCRQGYQPIFENEDIRVPIWARNLHGVEYLWAWT